MTCESRNTNLEVMVEPISWSFLTNHAQVLICLAEDADVRLREVGDTVGITERAAHHIVADLIAAGYVSRERNGRRNRYTVQRQLPLPIHWPEVRRSAICWRSCGPTA